MMTNIKNQNVTTDQIQTLLDVNKKLILAIMDHQNKGEFSKSAMFQAQLKKNLFFLAALSDAQAPPSEPGSPTQLPTTPHYAMPQEHNVQQPLTAAVHQVAHLPLDSSFQFDAVDPAQDQPFHSSDNSKPFEGT